MAHLWVVDLAVALTRELAKAVGRNSSQADAHADAVRDELQNKPMAVPGKGNGDRRPEDPPA